MYKFINCIISDYNILQIEEPTTKEFGGDTLDFQDIFLKDKKGKVWVAMRGEMVSPYQVGNLLKITKCKVKLFNGQKKLSTTLPCYTYTKLRPTLLFEKKKKQLFFLFVL